MAVSQVRGFSHRDRQEWSCASRSTRLARSAGSGAALERTSSVHRYRSRPLMHCCAPRARVILADSRSDSSWLTAVQLHAPQPSVSQSVQVRRNSNQRSSPLGSIEQLSQCNCKEWTIRSQRSCSQSPTPTTCTHGHTRSLELHQRHRRYRRQPTQFHQGLEQDRRALLRATHDQLIWDRLVAIANCLKVRS